MRVTIERKAGKVSTGWFSSTHAFTIDLTILFTQAELDSINGNNLTKYLVFSRPYHPGYGISDPEQFKRILANGIYVGDLLRFSKQQRPQAIFHGASSPEADRAEQELREGLKGLKALIDGASSTPSKDTFEL